MSKANYGSLARCDDTETLVDAVFKNKTPVEVCGLINYGLNLLLAGENKVIDGDNPSDAFLSEVTYDPDTDKLYFWTENL